MKVSCQAVAETKVSEIAGKEPQQLLRDRCAYGTLMVELFAPGSSSRRLRGLDTA